MKNNHIIFFPALLGIPTLALISGQSGETIALGFVSFSLLLLFLYVIQLMGKSEHPAITEESLSEPISHAPKQQGYHATDSLENETMQMGHQPKTVPTDNELGRITDEDMPSSMGSSAPIKIRTKAMPDPQGIQDYRKERFKKDILGPMVRDFLGALPLRSKIDNSLFCVFESGEYREFLIQRGKLFINCDTDAVLEAEDTILENLADCQTSFLQEGHKILLPIATPTKMYGGLVLESISGFNEKDAYILKAQCDRFAWDWETRNDYEIAILDPQTMVYNRSHYKTIVREKFLSQEPVSLLYLEITGARNREDLIAFFAEYLPYAIYRIEDRILAFFLREEELSELSDQLATCIQILDGKNFYAEFVIGYSPRLESFPSSQDWENHAKHKLQLARKQAPRIPQVAVT